MNYRITPDAVVAFVTGDEEALIAALGLEYGQLNPFHLDDDGDMHYDLKKYPSILLFDRKFWAWADAEQIGRPPLDSYEEIFALRLALKEAAQALVAANDAKKKETKS